MGERIRLGETYDHEEYGEVLVTHHTHDNELWFRRVQGRDNAGAVSTSDTVLAEDYKTFLGRVSMPTYPERWDQLRKAVYKRDSYECQGCGDGGGPEGDVELHAHHIVPLSMGGSNMRSNLITLCDECHARIHGGLS
jgi:5-methylcytosine-specific restriction endonuclease McrA